ncbi:hypothetical protein [Aureimonas glaciei]|uniref:hypothetical protein n=1 Tax=Aureimonas glaciei TaxID=1776957 RepID=UPI0016699A15|nr:hypothetical protein [Aureimonas glaciei]
MALLFVMRVFLPAEHCRRALFARRLGSSPSDAGPSGLHRIRDCAKIGANMNARFS